MKIKVIDLLVKIANGEKVPKKIKFMNSIWEYCKNGSTQDYINDYDKYLMELIPINKVGLNDEVEIIEEPKKIEKIKSNGNEFYSDYIDTWISKNNTDAYCEFLMNKINELIDEINNLREK